ncbi:hypothetical protein ACFVMC_23335 [Nocardia sp. NPDC127579]|uniref:hypothetical protein n=1 Tax=Nocardia sp. NPDC127579 TaxID=3345402 RepID=UPI00362B1BDB
MAGGVYNHYDDPDEYWDEEPLQPRASKSAPPPLPTSYAKTQPSFSSNSDAGAGSASESASVTPSAESAIAAAASGRRDALPAKTSMIDVEVAADGLPIRIVLKPSWKASFSPPEYGQSIMDAYQHGRLAEATRLMEAGIKPRPTLPSLRDATPLLLRTRTHEEFKELYDKLFRRATYTLNGPGYNAYNEPGLIVTASRSRILSLTIDPSWAAEVDVSYLAQDIVDCCNKVRVDRLEYVRDIYLDQESDQQLAGRLNRHEAQLLRNGV